MLSSGEILALAQIYAEAEGVTLGTVGRRACGNYKVFFRIAEGRGANSKTLAAAEQFFRSEWPAGAVWPGAIAGPWSRGSDLTLWRLQLEGDLRRLREARFSAWLEERSKPGGADRNAYHREYMRAYMRKRRASVRG